MYNMNPLLLTDFYKTTHAEQYPAGLTKMVSYFTPRMSRIVDENKLTVIGVQGYCKEFLIDYFNRNFFNRKKEDVVEEYKLFLDAHLGNGAYSLDKVEKLHDLGYLPLEIRSIPEGSRIDMKVPMIEISNTHPDFVWLVNTNETTMCAYLWHMMVTANVGYKYRTIVNKYYEASVDNNIPRARALGNFSMRGEESIDSAMMSGAAWLLSFLNVATIPSIQWLKQYYSSSDNNTGFGAISTEHSVMCSNIAIDGDEITHAKRLLTEIYPKHSFSMVADSRDFWNFVDNVLPHLKKEVEEHEGYFAIRGDSGNPVEIIAGKKIVNVANHYVEMFRRKNVVDEFLYLYADGEKEIIFRYDDNHYAKMIKLNGEYALEFDYILTSQDKGLAWRLLEIFGGTINSKGFYILNEKVKALYGDSITPINCEEIYKRLIINGIACNSVSLGVGSFSMQCHENEDGTLSPFTRDTYAIAVKATYAEDKDGKPINIFKDPVTDSGFKKSQKGCCAVLKSNDKYSYVDELTFDESRDYNGNQFVTVFKDGKIVNETSLDNIRNTLWNGEF